MRQRTRSRSIHHERDRITNRKFGEALRRARLGRGMTQEQLSWATGVERAFISELERGVKGASVNMLFKLAEGLGIRPSELLVLVEDGAPPLV